MSDICMDFAKEFIENIKLDEENLIITEFRKTDGYLNATKLCESAGKTWSKYYRNKSTQEYLTKLSLVHKIPISEYIENKKTSLVNGKVLFSKKKKINEKYLIEHLTEAKNQDTFIHPEIAIDLARWCCSKFHVKVVQSIEKYINEDKLRKTCEILDLHSQISFVSQNYDYLKKKYDNMSVLYFILVYYCGYIIIKFGQTNNFPKRLYTHKKELGNDIKIIKIYELLNQIKN